MENAARGMAEVARSMLEETSPSSASEPAIAPRGPVVVVCGSGNNGGDGYAMARHLANAGHPVRCVALRAPRAGSDAATNALICRRMGIPEVGLEALLTAPALVVDAIFGTGLDRPVRGIEGDAIAAINRCGCGGVPILAVDLPSGVNNDAGEPFGDAVRATATAVTVAPRPAMRLAPACEFFGRVTIIDIGSPACLCAEFGRRADG